MFQKIYNIYINKSINVNYKNINYNIWSLNFSYFFRKRLVNAISFIINDLNLSKFIEIKIWYKICSFSILYTIYAPFIVGFIFILIFI